jgi:hypothetical protein
MPRLLGKDTSNPWLEKDRQDQRRVVLTAVIFAAVVIGGIALLIYALMQA